MFAAFDGLFACNLAASVTERREDAARRLACQDVAARETGERAVIGREVVRARTAPPQLRSAGQRSVQDHKRSRAVVLRATRYMTRRRGT